MTQEVATRTRYSNDELREVRTIQDAIALAGAPVDLSEVLGSGFEVVPTNKKGQLIDKGFLVLESHFSNGDKGEFVSLTIMTEDGQKRILNDGSSGIRDQVHELENRNIPLPWLVRKGLRSSVYYFDPKNPDAEKSREPVEGYDKAETFYLSY